MSVASKGLLPVFLTVFIDLLGFGIVALNGEDLDLLAAAPAARRTRGHAQAAAVDEMQLVVAAAAGALGFSVAIGAFFDMISGGAASGAMRTASRAGWLKRPMSSAMLMWMAATSPSCGISKTSSPLRSRQMKVSEAAQSSRRRITPVTESATMSRP